MEQLVWAILIIIFIIFTALKNRARNRPDTTTDKTGGTDYKTGKKPDKLSRYMEELLGIEISEAKPQIIRNREKPKYVEKTVKAKPKPETEEKIGQFESPLSIKYEEKVKQSFPKKKNIYCAKFPWGTLSKKDLPRAIVLSEIIGPPVSKRKEHRLF